MCRKSLAPLCRKVTPALCTRAPYTYRIRLPSVRRVREGDLGMVVCGDEQHLPAGSFHRVLAVARHAMRGPLDTSEFLSLDVQQVARCFVFITNDGLGRLQISQLRQSCSSQDTAHGALGDAKRNCNASLCQVLVAQLHDCQRLCCRDSSGGAGKVDWKHPKGLAHLARDTGPAICAPSAASHRAVRQLRQLRVQAR